MLVDFIEQCHNEVERKEVFGKIKPVISHLNEIFNELVESIQINQDTDIISDKIILADCLKRILKGFESQIKEFNADIRIKLNDISTIYYPKNYFNSILTNLISNSLKYKSPHKKPIIKIEINKKNGNILLSVKDNGLGLDLNMHGNRLFKIRNTFHKHPDARGFGLFMTKTQVEAMDGKIWAESIPGKGSTFFIEFKNQKV